MADDPHHNEKLVGEALKDVRSQVQIVTKFGIRFDETSKAVNKPLIPDARPETIRASVEGSLRRLQTDHIDLHFQHRVDPNVEPEAVAQVMADLIREGKITHWGISEVTEEYLRRTHSVWLIDQPRRGEAGQTSVAGTISTKPSDQTWYTQFRIGTYLNDAFTYNEGSQFPQGEDVLDQFFRQMTPDTGMDNAGGDQNIDNEVVAQAVAASIDEIYERTGQNSILVTHSQGGLPGWEVPRYTDHVAAIVAIEPGAAPTVDSEAYNALLEQKIPVTFYYGDYIGEAFTDVPAAAMWSMMAATVDTFTEAYNAADGSSTVVHLPDEGIPGNSHFMFQELNNDVIADHIENWIQETVA